MLTILVTIDGLTYVWPRLTERSAVTTSAACASRVRKPSAPALIASENCSLPQRHSSARIFMAGVAARIDSIVWNDEHPYRSYGRHSVMTTSAADRITSSQQRVAVLDLADDLHVQLGVDHARVARR